jgi:hypothetical protein
MALFDGLVDDIEELRGFLDFVDDDPLGPRRGGLPFLEQSAGMHLEFGFLFGVKEVYPEGFAGRELPLQEGRLSAAPGAEKEKAVFLWNL